MKRRKFYVPIEEIERDYKPRGDLKASQVLVIGDYEDGEVCQ